MNLPNRLTILRVLLVPPMVVFCLLPQPGFRYAALALFIIASVTDLLDGKIARKRGLVTNFGKFLDPVADKMLVLSAMICLASKGECPAWLCVPVACRELAVDGLRLIACEKGRVLAAGQLGKWKTAFQMTMLIYCMAGLPKLLPPYGRILAYVLWAAVAALTLASGTEYFLKNRDVLKDDK